MEPAQDWYDVIDDFYPVMALLRTVLIPRRDAGSDLHVNVAAALAAEHVGIRSVDSARRTYVDEERIRNSPAVYDFDLLRETYDIAYSYVSDARKRLDPSSDDDVSIGEFASSVALERIATSFKSVHLLYRLGHRVDGDTVARLILEQMAWALEAPGHESLDSLELVKPSKAIASLKKFYPKAGEFYGILSKSTHIGLPGHRALFDIVNDRGAIVTREDALEHGSVILLRLADIWVAVWELTQAPYLRGIFSVVRRAETYGGFGNERGVGGALKVTGVLRG